MQSLAIEERGDPSKDTVDHYDSTLRDRSPHPVQGKPQTCHQGADRPTRRTVAALRRGCFRDMPGQSSGRSKYRQRFKRGGDGDHNDGDELNLTARRLGWIRIQLYLEEARDLPRVPSE